MSFISFCVHTIVFFFIPGNTFDKKSFFVLIILLSVIKTFTILIIILLFVLMDLRRSKEEFSSTFHKV